MSYNIFRIFGYLLEPVLSDLVETEKHANSFVAYCMWPGKRPGFLWHHVSSILWSFASCSLMLLFAVMVSFVAQSITVHCICLSTSSKCWPDYPWSHCHVGFAVCHMTILHNFSIFTDGWGVSWFIVIVVAAGGFVVLHCVCLWVFLTLFHQILTIWAQKNP